MGRYFIVSSCLALSSHLYGRKESYVLPHRSLFLLHTCSHYFCSLTTFTWIHVMHFHFLFFVYTSINLICTHLFLCRSHGVAGANSSCWKVKAGYIPWVYQSNAGPHNYTYSISHVSDSLKSLIDLWHMVFEYAFMGRTCKLNTERSQLGF